MSKNYPETCPDCGQQGTVDMGYITYACGTEYRLEKWIDGSFTLYGPNKGRSTECYESEIQSLKTRVRFLTQDKINLMKSPLPLNRANLTRKPA